VRRSSTLAALGLALAAGPAASANAAVSSASIDGATATLSLDGADDNVAVSVSGGLLGHGQTTGGLSSGSDWDSAHAGDQTVPADGSFSVVVNGGGGNDTLSVHAKTTELATATLNGDAGDDVLTGGETNDTLNGGDGNDRLAGAGGFDEVTRGDGDDTMVWNNGDASDRMDGEAGEDVVEVNGSATLGDTFLISPEAAPGRILFTRTNLTPFNLVTASERFEVNGLGGDDSITAAEGAGARTLLLIDGDEGDDQVDVRDGAPGVALGGPGEDSVIADGPDLDLLDGFESVDVPPPLGAAPVPVMPPPPPAPTTPPATVARSTLSVTIKAATTKVTRYTARVALTCPAASPVTCTGTLVLRTAGRVRLGGVSAVLELGTARYDIAPGATTMVAERLPTPIDRVAARNGHVKALVIASTQQRLTLLLRRPKR
jgi:hypothetical protein